MTLIVCRQVDRADFLAVCVCVAAAAFALCGVFLAFSEAWAKWRGPR